MTVKQRETYELTQAVASSLSEPGDVEQTLRRITHTARDTVPGVDYASICVRHHRRGLETIAPTSPLLCEANAMQVALNEGPSFETPNDGAAIYSPDLAVDGRWPRYGAALADLGLLSQLAVEIAHPTEAQVSLNLYSRSRDAFTDHQRLAELFSSQSQIALRYAQEVHALTVALSTGTTVGRATGVMMERQGVSADVALRTLEGLAKNAKGSLVEAAESWLIPPPAKSLRRA